MKLTDALDLFLTAKAHRSPRTVEWYGEQIRVFLNWLSAHGWNGGRWLDAATIDLYLAEQRNNHQQTTVHARYRALRAWFNWLVDREYLQPSDNPMSKVAEPPRPKNVQKRRIEQSSYDRLYASITGDTWLDWRDRALLLVLFWSGLRLGECAALTVGDINLDRGEIAVLHGKGNKARLAPCTPELRQVLLSYLMSRPVWHGPELWLSSDGWTGLRPEPQLSAEGIRQMLRRRCKAAGVTYRNPHAFRHGFAVEMLNAGADISAISAMMGHSSVKVTEQEYAFWLTEGLHREYDEALKRRQRNRKP